MATMVATTTVKVARCNKSISIFC